VQTTAAKQSARKRRKPRANVDNELWLILDLDGIGQVWTSAAALRMPVAPIAALLQKKYKLNDPKKARPAAAFNAISRVILPADAIIHEEGRA
jgi:hypothetical protein